MTAIDLGPATERMATLVRGVADEQLGAPTPCEHTTLGALLDHVASLTMAFTAAATKTPIEGADGPPPPPDASRLGDDWRTRIPSALAGLANAWDEPEAWTGMTRAGGLDLPGEVAGVVTLDELVVHGWDVAVASGQPYDPDYASLQACMEFVEQFSAPEQAAMREGMYGPVVPVPDDAPLLDRLIGLTGRDPNWSPGRSAQT